MSRRYRVLRWNRPREIPNAGSPPPGFALPMKANDKNTKAFPLVDVKFGSGVVLLKELRFWVIYCTVILLARMLGWF